MACKNASVVDGQPDVQPQVVMAVTTYKRNWQLETALPMNLMTSWKFRHAVRWVVVDLNDPSSDEAAEIEDLMKVCAVAVHMGFLYLIRRRDPGNDGWTGWHASIAKNCGLMAAQHVAGDNCVVVNVDNDNLLTEDFVLDVCNRRDSLTVAEGDHAAKMCGVFYRRPNCASTTGRIAAGCATLRRMGGYDQELAPTGGQDVDLTRRLSKMGRTERVTGQFVGTTLTNYMECVGKKHAHKRSCEE